jgi:HEAT repeat protein
LGWAAAGALAAYGIEARRAVPAILKAYPLGSAGRFDWEGDAAGQALEHIGPPDERDFDAVCACLTHEDEEVQILASKSLSWMGLKGGAAALALKVAAKETAKRFLELQRKFESKPDDVRDNSGRVFVAVECLAAAIWHVTHDPERFLGDLQEIVLAAESRINCPDPSPWGGFSADDCLRLERLLRSSNRNVQQTAIDGVSEIGPRAASLKGVVLELAGSQDEELSRQAIQALVAIGPSAAEGSAPILVAKLHDRTLPLAAFARAVRALKLRSEQVQAILKDGLQHGDRQTVTACAEALVCITLEPARLAALVVDAARNGRCEHRDAIGVLQGFHPGGDTVLPYLVEQVDNQDYWTRHDAIGALGAFGPAASASLTILKTQLKDESTKIRLQAGKSIFQISGDVSHLTEQLERALAAPEIADRSSAIATITELGPSGAPFLRLVVRTLQGQEPLLVQESISVLRSIGNPAAMVELEKIATSSDWLRRSQATAALRDLRRSGERGGN